MSRSCGMGQNRIPMPPQKPRLSLEEINHCCSAEFSVLFSSFPSFNGAVPNRIGLWALSKYVETRNSGNRVLAGRKEKYLSFLSIENCYCQCSSALRLASHQLRRKLFLRSGSKKKTRNEKKSGAVTPRFFHYQPSVPTPHHPV